MKFFYLSIILSLVSCRSGTKPPNDKDWTSGASNAQSFQEERSLEQGETTKDQFQTTKPNTNQSVGN